MLDARSEKLALLAMQGLHWQGKRSTGAKGSRQQKAGSADPELDFLVHRSRGGLATLRGSWSRVGLKDPTSRLRRRTSRVRSDALATRRAMRAHTPRALGIRAPAALEGQSGARGPQQTTKPGKDRGGQREDPKEVQDRAQGARKASGSSPGNREPDRSELNGFRFRGLGFWEVRKNGRIRPK